MGVSDWGHSLLTESLDRLRIVPQIKLGAHEDNRDVRGVMGDFRVPLFLCQSIIAERSSGYAYLAQDVVERGGGHNRKANEEDIGLRVGEGTQTVIILLTGSIPKSKTDRLAINHNIGRVIIEASQQSLVRAKVKQHGYTYTVGIYSPGKALVV